MQETRYTDNQGRTKIITEIFGIPDDGNAHDVLKQKHSEALAAISNEGGKVLSIKQARVDRYAPCPCGSGRKFKFCCEARMRQRS